MGKKAFKNFLGQQFFCQKFFLGKKKLGEKDFWVKKDFGPKKKFGSKRFVSKIIVSNKKPGRVNPIGRIYPPPQRVVGLKLCWVVVGIAG